MHPNMFSRTVELLRSLTAASALFAALSFASITCCSGSTNPSSIMLPNLGPDTQYEISSPDLDESVARSLYYYTITFSAAGLFVLLCIVLVTSAEYYKAKKMLTSSIVPSEDDEDNDKDAEEEDDEAKEEREKKEALYRLMLERQNKVTADCGSQCDDPTLLEAEVLAWKKKLRVRRRKLIMQPHSEVDGKNSMAPSYSLPNLSLTNPYRLPSAQSNYSTPVKNTTLEVIHYTEITKASQPSNLSDAPTAVQHPPQDKQKEKENEKSVAANESDSTIVFKRRASSDLIPVPEGSMVEGNYRGKGVWFSGTVMRAFEGMGVDGGRGNALYDIQYDDGEVERGMEAWYVRVKTPVAGEPVRAAVPAAPLPLHTQPTSQPSNAPVAVAAAAAVGTQKAPVLADMSAISVSGSAATATAVVKGDMSAVPAKATSADTAVKHNNTASSVPASLGTEKKNNAATNAANTTATATASRAADDTAISASKTVASTTGTATAHATAPAPSTVAATSSSQPSATTTAAGESGGMGGAQNKVADKADPSRFTAPATVTAATAAATVTAPSAALSTVKVSSQATNGASSAATTTAISASANASTVSSTTQATVRPSSASTSASSWAKTTPSPWTQKPQEGVEEGVKVPVRPVSAAPSRTLAVDTAHSRGSDPDPSDPFDDSSESVEKGLKKGLGLGLDPKVQDLSAQPAREQEGALKQPVVQKDQAVKEVVKGVRGEVVPPLKLSGVMDEIKEGSLVEGNYAKIGEWFTGKITKKRSDGSFDILYDDGDVELGVRPPFVRLRR